MVNFRLNGKPFSYGGDASAPLLWVIREAAGLTGTRFGCGAGLCGACTVHIDGVAQRSCSVPVTQAEGRDITTIEGLASDGLHPVQQAWLEEDVAQCGYCQAGQIMNAVDLLKRHPSPTDAQIDELQTNLCRCGTYARVREAILLASKLAYDASTGADS
jgi:isoquinoline 1-oxidoreductase alpha subunit